MRCQKQYQKNFKKGENGNFIYFFKLSFGWFPTHKELKNCVIFITYCVEIFHFLFCHVFFIFRFQSFFGTQILLNFLFRLKKCFIVMYTFAEKNKITYRASTFLETFQFWRYLDFNIYLSVHFVRSKAKKVTQVTLTFLNFRLRQIIK